MEERELNWEETADNLYESIMETIKRIKKVVQNLREDCYFSLMEDYPEDFTELRTDWDDLALNYRTMYYALMNIEDLIRTFENENKNGKVN